MIDLNDVLLAMSNIPVDNPIAEIWGRGLQGGYKIIEYTGSLPITINANGDALIDYRIYGADGGVGEPADSGEPAGYKLPMTVQGANLFDKNATNTDNGFVAHAYVDSRNVVMDYYTFNVSEYIPVKPNTAYYAQNISSVSVSYCSICFYTADRTFISAISYKFRIDIPFTTPANAAYIRMSVRISNLDIITLTEGTEPPSEYIPYNKQTVPVYIGENQLDSVEGVSDYVDKSSGKIVRMIGEYTFTGDESFNKYGSSDVFYTSTTIDPVGITTVNTITMRCNHPAFTAIENKDTRYWLNPEADDICCFLPGGRSQVFLRSTSNFTTATECKAYLKAQYDNGTPVKISYWLKTPVEEDPPVPFPEIPTIDGTTTIDYDGTPKPSQVYVKYKGKERR